MNWALCRAFTVITGLALFAGVIVILDHFDMQNVRKIREIQLRLKSVVSLADCEQIRMLCNQPGRLHPAITSEMCGQVITDCDLYFE